jgi:hypothetical protein
MVKISNGLRFPEADFWPGLVLRIVRLPDGVIRTGLGRAP